MREKRGDRPLLRAKARNIALSTILTLAVGFLVGALCLRLTGYAPGSAYALMFSKLQDNFGQVIGKATPLIFTGLAVAVPYSVGMINIGAEGQVTAGAFMGALAGAYIPGLPPVLHVAVVILVGGFTGMFFAALCGWLKFKTGASEVVTTVMFNSIISLACEYLCNGPLNGVQSQPQTKLIFDSAKIGRVNPTDNWSYAVFIAIGFAILTWVFIRKTSMGYKVRASGLNPVASAYKGIDVTKISFLAMALGGFLAGVGGACEVMAVRYSYYHGFTTNYGYMGMGVALIAWNNPIAIIPAAFLLAAIRVGGMVLDRLTEIPSQFIWVLQGAMIMMMGARGIIDVLSNLVGCVRKSKGLRNERKQVEE